VKDRGLFKHRDRLGPLSGSAQGLGVLQRSLRVPGTGAKATAKRFQIVAGVGGAACLGLLTSDPVISDKPAVWQLQSPSTRIAAAVVDVRRRAEKWGWRNCRSIYFDLCRRLVRNAYFFNPKFPLSGGTPGLRSRGLARLLCRRATGGAGRSGCPARASV
jgi:hypothetical protein